MQEQAFGRMFTSEWEKLLNGSASIMLLLGQQGSRVALFTVHEKRASQVYIDYVG